MQWDRTTIHIHTLNKKKEINMIHREQIEEIIEDLKRSEFECRQQGSGYGAAICKTTIEKLQELLDKEQVGGVP